MRARIILAVIPAAVFAAAYAYSRPGKPPEPKKASYVEQVHGIDSFDRRFGQQPDPAIRRVRTVTIVPVPAQETAVAEPKPAPGPVATPAPVRRVTRKASLDTCQRHGMRKVHYGKRWRCRR